MDVLDSKVLSSLQAVPSSEQASILHQFFRTEIASMKNPSAYLSGIIRSSRKPIGVPGKNGGGRARMSVEKQLENMYRQGILKRGDLDDKLMQRIHEEPEELVSMALQLFAEHCPPDCRNRSAFFTSQLKSATRRLNAQGPRDSFGRGSDGGRFDGRGGPDGFGRLPPRMDDGPPMMGGPMGGPGGRMSFGSGRGDGPVGDVPPVRDFTREQIQEGVRVDELHDCSPYARFVGPFAARELQNMFDAGLTLVDKLDDSCWRQLAAMRPDESLDIVQEVGESMRSRSIRNVSAYFTSVAKKRFPDITGMAREVEDAVNVGAIITGGPMLQPHGPGGPGPGPGPGGRPAMGGPGGPGAPLGPGPGPNMRSMPRPETQIAYEGGPVGGPGGGMGGPGPGIGGAPGPQPGGGFGYANNAGPGPGAGPNARQNVVIVQQGPPAGPASRPVVIAQPGQQAGPMQSIRGLPGGGDDVSGMGGPGGMQAMHPRQGMAMQQGMGGPGGMQGQGGVSAQQYQAQPLQPHMQNGGFGGGMDGRGSYEGQQGGVMNAGMAGGNMGVYASQAGMGPGMNAMGGMTAGQGQMAQQQMQSQQQYTSGGMSGGMNGSMGASVGGGAMQGMTQGMSGQGLGMGAAASGMYASNAAGMSSQQGGMPQGGAGSAAGNSMSAGSASAVAGGAPYGQPQGQAPAGGAASMMSGGSMMNSGGSGGMGPVGGSMAGAMAQQGNFGAGQGVQQPAQQMQQSHQQQQMQPQQLQQQHGAAGMQVGAMAGAGGSGLYAPNTGSQQHVASAANYSQQPPPTLSQQVQQRIKQLVNNSNGSVQFHHFDNAVCTALSKLTVPTALSVLSAIEKTDRRSVTAVQPFLMNTIAQYTGGAYAQG